MVDFSRNLFPDQGTPPGIPTQDVFTLGPAGTQDDGMDYAYTSILWTPEAAMDTVAELLLRHSTGDWGDLSANDATFNEQCVERNQQVLSSYPLDVGKIWVITAPDRTYTTLLLPGEY